jgi:hypothetical protein
MRQALSALTALSTTAVCLSAALVACSLGGDDDDDDGSNGGQGPGTGGSGVSFTGGTSSTNGGGSQGGSGNTSGNGSMPAECEPIPGLSECGSAKQTADIKVVNMMLVVDKSGSMADTPAGFDDNKWVSLGSALKTALGGVKEQMNLGLIMYPFGMNANTTADCAVAEGADAVNVPIAAGTSTVGEIVRIVENTSPSGGTPTAAALKAAYHYFKTGAGSTMTGNRYVLLATDGGPNCNGLNVSCRDNADLCTVNLDAQAPMSTVTCTRPNCCINATSGQVRSDLCLDNGAVVDAITLLKGEGVTTYVVGIPGTEVYSAYLDQFAEASGQISPTGPRKYYEVKADGGVDSLTATFSGIVTQLVTSCDIPLDPAPDDPTLVNVAIDCELQKADDPTAGWKITPDGKILQLQGTTCERIQTSGAKRVDLYYGCRPPA